MSEKENKIPFGRRAKSFHKQVVAPVTESWKDLKSYAQEWREAFGCMRDNISVRLGGGSPSANILYEVNQTRNEPILPGWNHDAINAVLPTPQSVKRFVVCLPHRIGSYANEYIGWTPGWQRRFNKKYPK